MNKSLIATTVGLGLSLNLGGGVIQNKAVWFDSLNGFDSVLREALTAHAGHVTITESKEQAQILIRLDNRAGGEYPSTLLREKHGRAETKLLVARDRKTGRTLVSEPVAPRAELESAKASVNSFARKLVSLP